MRIGIDEYTIHHLDAQAIEKFALLERLGLEGIQFGNPLSLSARLDAGEIREAVAEAQRRNLVLEVGIPGLNPLRPSPIALRLGEGDFLAGLWKLLRAAALVGSRPIRTFVGGPGDRTRPDGGWIEQQRAAAEVARTLSPLVRDLNLQLAFELHADATSFELLRLIEEVGEDVAGVCLDTGNLPIVLEEPVAATRRVAAHVITTHLKDCVVFFTDRGLGTQSRPWGSGIIPLNPILAALAANPALNLFIEDHDRIFPTDIFDPGWQALYPDLQVEEMTGLIGQARACERRFLLGEVASPATLEAIPWAVQAEERIRRAAAHVKHIAEESNLR